MAAFNKSTDDHSLDSVPHDERQNWLQLTWNTTGIVTTLIQIFLGALVTFVAGIWIGIIAGLVVTVVGALLGWGVGHVAYKTGLSSSMLSRQHGFGRKGSVLVALTFGFMIIGFIALENALLYKGLLFWLGLEDTVSLQIAVYGIMSLSGCSSVFIHHIARLSSTAGIHDVRRHSFIRPELGYRTDIRSAISSRSVGRDGGGYRPRKICILY